MRHVLAATLGVAVFAAAADARAATITTSAEFAFVLDSRVTPEAFLVDLPFLGGGVDLFFGFGRSSVSVQPFDPTLGRLLGVDVSLESSFVHETRHLIFSLGPQVQGLSFVFPLELRFARLGGQLHAHEVEFYGECADNGQACAAVAQAAGDFAFAAADDPTVYLRDGPVEFSLVLDLDGGASYNFLPHPHRAFFLDSVTAWSGVLRVAYDYEPAAAAPTAAPAPESASLLALGLAGLWLRRSARAAARRVAAR